MPYRPSWASQRHIELQQIGFGGFSFFWFLYPLFVYSCPTSFDKKYDLISHLDKQMDIFFRKIVHCLKGFLKRKQFWPNPILVCAMCITHEVFLVLEAYYMRSAVPVFVIFSHTCKYRINLVACYFCHYYRTNFVKTNFFSHHSEHSYLPSLQLVLCRVAAVKRLPVHQP